MNLSPASRQVLTDTLDPLLRYANRQLHLVCGEVSLHGDIDTQTRAELVARALWQDISLISHFVQENPCHLDARHLEVARDLTHVIYDSFVFEGTEDGYGVFLHETGLYHALEPGIDGSHSLPDHAVFVRTALAPFEGKVVRLMPFAIVGVPSKGQCEDLRQMATSQGGAGPTSDGDVLARRAAPWSTQRGHHRSREIHDTATPKPAGPGFHRGALAGLSGLRRKQACDARYDLLARSSGVHRMEMRLRSTDAHFFPFTLGEGLELLDDDWLESIVQHFAEHRVTTDMSRTAMIDLACKHIASDTDQRDNALMWCEDAQFALLRRLMDENPLSLASMAPSEARTLYPIIPYVFILHENESLVAWMPPEVRTLMSGVDLDEVARVRSQLSQAARSADALASMCGIISLDDAYERYRAVATEPLDREHFELTLMEMEQTDRRDTYALWTHEGVTYLISAELSPVSALPRVLQHNFHDRMVDLSPSSCPDTGRVVALDMQESAALEQLLDEELDRLEANRLSLLRLPRSLSPHALDPAMTRQPFVDYLLETPALARVRAYVDEHVPDDQDDYEFPTTFARALVISSLFMHESYEDTMDVIRLFDMSACEGSAWPHLLGRLVTDVYNALPRWELNGWSLAENTERVTGRPHAVYADIVYGKSA